MCNGKFMIKTICLYCIVACFVAIVMLLQQTFSYANRSSGKHLLPRIPNCAKIAWAVKCRTIINKYKMYTFEVVINICLA